MVAATTGPCAVTSTGAAVTMPAIAAAALASTRAETEFSPATSVTAGIMTTSLTPT